MTRALRYIPFSLNQTGQSIITNQTLPKGEDMIRVILVSLAFFLGFNYQEAVAKEKATFAAFNYPFLCDVDGKGVYSDIVQAAFEAVNIETEVEVLPIRRGLKYFWSNLCDLYFT